MRLLLSLYSEHFRHVREMLFGEAFVEWEEEGEFSAVQLKNHLLLRNSRRVFSFTAIQLLIGLAGVLIGLFGMGAVSFGSVLFLVGSVLTAVSSVLFFLLYEQELRRPSHNYSRLRTYLYLYWGAFISCGLILSVGEYRAVHTVYSFCLALLLALLLPILSFLDSMIAAALFAVPAAVYGAAENRGGVFFLFLLLGAFVFLWISSEKYHCYAGMQLREKQMERAAQRSLRMSRTDSLTGMLNHAGLNAKFNERYGNDASEHRIAVLLINIDQFRLYNHQFGYDKGDRCLHEICNCIRIFSRPITDMVSRFGGDDFVLVLEDLSEPEVVRFAEQLRRGVERMALPLGENGIVTISIGISEIAALKKGSTYSALLNEADLQLMIAKNSGKNCIGYRGQAFLSEDRRMTREPKGRTHEA